MIRVAGDFFISLIFFFKESPFGYPSCFVFAFYFINCCFYFAFLLLPLVWFVVSFLWPLHQARLPYCAIPSHYPPSTSWSHHVSLLCPAICRLVTNIRLTSGQWKDNSQGCVAFHVGWVLGEHWLRWYTNESTQQDGWEQDLPCLRQEFKLCYPSGSAGPVILWSSVS